MSRLFATGALALGLALTLSAGAPSALQAEDDMGTYAIAIHGGAGTIRRENLTPEIEAQYEAALTKALQAAEDILANDGTSMDAVVAAIQIMEDIDLFNAGKGAVFTAEGKNELDASIMDGATKNAGAVAGVTTVKSPIELARAVMDSSVHVMLSGAGAEKFAAEQELELVDPEYFYTERRWQQLQRAKQQRVGNVLDIEFDHDEHKFGTVGAVALDRHGNLAAGTSTGGMTNKKWGRIGDAPVIGAGTYADNASCAVSATGHGEFFIRYTVARDICALMEYKGVSLEEAANFIVMDRLVEVGGDGGIISVDKDGNIALVFNSLGMYRGSLKEGGAPYIGIYRE